MKKITWLLSGDEHVEEFRPPGNVVTLESGKKLEELLASGEIPAAINVEVNHPDVRPLIPNPREAAFEALRLRGHYPINHTVVVKNDVLDAQPDLATDLFNAFVEAKQLYLRNPTDVTHQRVLQITGGDPLPYGVEPNRQMIEAVIQYAQEQEILTRPFSMKDLFAPGTLNLIG